MEKWECTACGFIYDPENGDPDNGIEPGTVVLGRNISRRWPDNEG